MKMFYKNGVWHHFPNTKLFNAYTMIDGKLAQFSLMATKWESAYNETRKELGMSHRSAVMVVIK